MIFEYENEEYEFPDSIGDEEALKLIKQDRGETVASAPVSASEPNKPFALPSQITNYVAGAKQVSADYDKRFKERADKVQLPTVAGDAVYNKTGNKLLAGIAAGPERTIRAVGGAAANLAEAPLSAVNALLAGYGSKGFKSALKLAGKGLNALPMPTDLTSREYLETGKRSPLISQEQAEKIGNKAQELGDKYPAAKATVTGGLDLLNLVGLPTTKGIVNAAAGQLPKKKVSDVVKNRISEVTQIDRKLIQEATDPATLANLKNSAKRSGDGAINELVADAQQKIGSVNLATRTGANEKIEMVNQALDDAINANIKNTSDDFSKAIDVQSANVSTSGRGLNIENAVEKSQAAAGKRFGKNQETYLNPEVAKHGIITENNKTILANKFDELAKEVGYDKEKFRGVEKFGNSAALPADVTDFRQMMDLSTNANTTEDMLNQLRLVRKLKGSPKPDGSYYNSVMLGKVDKIYVDAIESQLNDFSVKNNITDDLVQMWKTNNAQYKTAIDALGDVKKGLGINKIKTESYAGRIADIGVDNLLNIKSLAANDPNIAQVWDELSNGFLDNVVAKSLDGSGNIDMKKFKSVWDNYDKTDQSLKSIMLGNKKTKSITDALNKYETALTENKEFKNVAAGLNKNTANFAKNSDIGTSLSSSAALSRVTNIGKNSQLNKNALADLEVLDQIYGTNYAKEAMDFYKAKQLDISPQGAVPWVSQVRTGRSALGPLMGQVISDIPVVGKSAGIILGIAGQSPAGAIAIYKLLDKLDNGVLKTASGAAASVKANKRLLAIQGTKGAAETLKEEYKTKQAMKYKDLYRK